LLSQAKQVVESEQLWQFAGQGVQTLARLKNPSLHLSQWSPKKLKEQLLQVIFEQARQLGLISEQVVQTPVLEIEPLLHSLHKLP
jgi:hypothetical protein